MLLSFNWLKKYLPLPPTTTPSDIAHRLTLSTVEVEGLNDLDKDLVGIVVGRIIAVEKHPNADRLRVCTVDVGSEKLSIVCGGSNVAENMLVAVAKIGAKVRWHGEGDPIVLEPATIRGVASEGMICGADEIGLVDRFPKHDEKEIVDLTHLAIAPGTPLAEALGLDDVIFEIDNKALSNRPDLWGHYGIAREIATLFEIELAPYTTTPTGRGKGKDLTINVQATQACPRYMTATLTGITVTESPLWLSSALTSLGIRPINNIVDITNYLMLDLGQPLHAFDAAALSDATINVRSALAGETVTLLDGKKHTLELDHLVIATPGSILALAGIMGAEHSGITSTTHSIVLEAATFDAATIRSGAGKLGLRTEASVRFEKSLDPELCPRALQKAVELIKQVCPTAELVGTPTDHYPDPSPKLVIEAPRTIFNTLLGTTIPEAIAEHILTRLGFGVTIKKNILSVVVPSWRATKDISLPEDIVEEVARIYGYDNVPALLPTLPLAPVIVSPLRALEQIAKTTLAERVGASETPSYSFVSEKQITALSDDTARYLELANPLSAEKPFLRRSLVPNLLEAARFNSAHTPRVRLFEIGKVFQAELAGDNMNPRHAGRLPRQDTHLALVISEEKNTQPFFEAKRALEILSYASNLPFTVSPAPVNVAHHHPGRSAEVLSGTTPVGALYELHPTTAEHYGLTHRVAILELNLSSASACTPVVRHVEKPSLFPQAERDIAFLVDINTAYEHLATTITTKSALVTSVNLLDHYQGEQLPSGTKSLTLRLTLGTSDRTLTTAEIDEVLQAIIKQLTEAHNITLR